MLSSIFTNSVAGYVEGRPRSPELLAEASVHGYTVGFWIAAGIFVLGVADPHGEPALAH